MCSFDVDVLGEIVNFDIHARNWSEKNMKYLDELHKLFLAFV